MSSGTNPERLSQNNELLTTNNEELVNLKTIIETLPETLDTSDATATPTDILLDKTAYVNGEKITGTKEIVATLQKSYPQISNYEDREFFVVESTTGDFTVQGNIAFSIQYDYFAPKIGLTADKIVVGNTILGVEGTSVGLDTSDADATAADILEYKTAYVNGQKITGTMTKIMNIESPCDTVTKGENVIYISKDNISPGYYPESNNIKISASYDLIVDAIGLLPGMLVEGNTVLGVEGTATELDVTKTEIWDTTNNDVQVGASGIEIVPDRAVITLTTPIQGGITSKEQLLLSGTGNIMIETPINDSGCLCAKLIGIESLESYMAGSGEIVVVVDTEGTYLGTYQYNAGTWSEIVSSSAYNNTLTETEYSEAVDTTETILGEEEI